ncbi:MAG: GNAT family N-acetyltransferase [bacterium]|nr:GNAT family N-acetyltransferase [bacterium]
MEIQQIKENPNNKDLNKIVSYWTYNPTEDRINERISRHLTEENLFTCSVNNQIIGAIAYKIIDNKTVEITGIGISKNTKKKGYGKLLLKKIEEILPPAKIIVETDNNAVGFYKNCEYKIYNTKVLDNGITRYQLEKALKREI